MQQMYQEAMVATVSHEQMNPLNSIINFTEYLQDWTANVLRQVDESIKPQEIFALSSDGSEGSSSMAESNGICLDKKELLKQMKILNIIRSSSRMMKLLNSGMLNLSKIK